MDVAKKRDPFKKIREEIAARHEEILNLRKTTATLTQARHAKTPSNTLYFLPEDCSDNCYRTIRSSPHKHKIHKLIKGSIFYLSTYGNNLRTQEWVQATSEEIRQTEVGGLSKKDVLDIHNAFLFLADEDELKKLYGLTLHLLGKIAENCSEEIRYTLFIQATLSLPAYINNGYKVASRIFSSVFLSESQKTKLLNINKNDNIIRKLEKFYYRNLKVISINHKDLKAAALSMVQALITVGIRPQSTDLPFLLTIGGRELINNQLKESYQNVYGISKSNTDANEQPNVFQMLFG